MTHKSGNYHMKLLVRIACATAVLGTPCIGLAAGSSAAGGLSISPAFLEHEARPGPVGQLRVDNSSGKTITVTARARPWIQGTDGVVRADTTRQLREVALSVTSFTLRPGESRSVSAALRSRPGSGSLYGAIEIVGTPAGQRPGNGIVARYRLVSGLRLNPPSAQRRYRVRVGQVRSTSRGTLLPVRSLGNTVSPVSGSVKISSASGTERRTIAGRRILPGGLVNLPLRSARLRAGSYKATVTLRQAGRRVATVTRPFRVR